MNPCNALHQYAGPVSYRPCHSIATVLRYSVNLFGRMVYHQDPQATVPTPSVLSSPLSNHVSVDLYFRHRIYRHLVASNAVKSLSKQARQSSQHV